LTSGNDVVRDRKYNKHIKERLCRNYSSALSNEYYNAADNVTINITVNVGGMLWPLLATPASGEIDKGDTVALSTTN
jgi:hypothetical protein